VDRLMVVWNAFPALLGGLAITVELALAFLGLGLALGILLALSRIYGNRFLASIASAFEQVFRGIPAIVFLFLFYFGSAQIGLNLSAFSAAILAMGLRSSAYQSQIFRGAIQSISSGQMMAARALGMNLYKAARHIILPQALRFSIAPWTNEYAGVLKDTSLCYAIGVTEIMRQGRYIVARTFGNSLLIYILIAIIYFILVYAGNRFFSFLEARLRIPGFETKGERTERI